MQLHGLAGGVLSISLVAQIYLHIRSGHNLIGGFDRYELGLISTICGLTFVIVSAARLHYSQRQAEKFYLSSKQTAETDGLTGALSRAAFMTLLEGRLTNIRSQQMAKQPVSEFSLLLLDVDYFKRINDTHGHAAGDQVLQKIVAIAQSRSNWLIARLGGDEFALLIDGADYRSLSDDISLFMQKLTATLHASGERRPFEGISIGIAQAPAHASLAGTLMTLADIALYEAKRNGRNQFKFFDQAMQRLQLERRQLARQLRAAILLDHLQIAYQPIVDRDRQVVGAEALLRWRDPLTGRSISPMDFIPVAEESTLIDQLGEWVFRRVCNDFASAGFPSITINVSGAQLLHDRLVPMISRVLRETGQDPRHLVLEITETVTINASAQVMDTIRNLKRLGFRLALDDFGTGNSGFAVLRDLPFDVVKIDKSYIQSLQSDIIAQVLVSGLGRLGDELNFRIVAEGVEDEAQFELAKLGGANRFQGYLFGRPELHQTSRPIAQCARLEREEGLRDFIGASSFRSTGEA